MFALSLTTALVLFGAQAALAAPTPLTPAAVVASSTKAPVSGRTFAASNLFDGDPTTAWHPDAAGAYGLGQWVRVDLGQVMDVTRVDIMLGVHRIDNGVDQVCVDARPRIVALHADSGASPWLYAEGTAHQATKNDLSLTTRTLTFVIRSVDAGRGGSGDVGVSEIAVYGAPAKVAPKPEAGPVACGSSRLATLHRAILERCAGTYRTKRPTAECTLLPSLLADCRADEAEWLPIAAEDFAKKQLTLEMSDDVNPPFPEYKAAFARDPAGAWTATSLSCTINGKPCGIERDVTPDDPSDPELNLTPTCRARSVKPSKR